MAFVVLDSKEDYASWIKLHLSMGCKFTSLAGKDDRPVMAIPDDVLDNLAEQKIAFTLLAEEQLPEFLSLGGMDYYRHLRTANPDHLYFNAPLPPSLHVSMVCTVPEVYTAAVLQIVQRYRPVDLHSDQRCAEMIPVDPDVSADARAMSQIAFTIPRVRRQALMDELVASGILASPMASIYVQSDPDGPPPRSMGAGFGR